MKLQLRLMIEDADRGDLISHWRRMAARSHHVDSILVDDAELSGQPKRRALVTDRAAEAMAAAERGERVIVLNPFTIPRPDRLSLAAMPHCVPAIVARQLPSIQRVKKAAVSQLGKLGLVRIHRWQPLRSTDTNVSLLAAELDLVSWLFERPPAQLHTLKSQWSPGDNEGALIQTHLGFQSLEPAGEPVDDNLPPQLPVGGMALVGVDTRSAQDSQYYTLSVIGSTGAAHVDDHHNLQLVLQRDGAWGACASETHLAIPGWIEMAAVSAGPSELWQAVNAACELAERVTAPSRSKPPPSDEPAVSAEWTPDLVANPVPPTELCASPDRPALRAIVLSAVKHAYIAHAVAAHPRFQIVGVTDERSQPGWVHERNQRLADHFQAPYAPFAGEDLSEAIASWKPDVAIVSSQAERHCRLAVLAAHAGLHIIVDKPLSTKLDECRRLVAAIHDAKVACLMWNRSFLPAILEARRLVAEGQLGRLRAVHCDFYFAKDAGPPIGSRDRGYPAISWLARQVEAHVDGSDGGVGHSPIGELQVEAVYPLAYLQLISGCKVQSVYARATSHFHQAHADNHVDDLSTVSLQMEHGVIGSMSIGRIGAASHPELGAIKLHLQGDQGAAVVNEPRPEVAIYYRGQPAGEFRHQRVADENNMLLLENFLAAVDHGRPTILDAEGGAEICATVEACLRSCYSGDEEAVEAP